MRRSISACLVLLVALALTATLCLAAPQDASSQSSQESAQSKEQAKKEKKKKDKKKGGEDVYDSAIFSTAVANSVLSDLRDGLEGHMQRLMLSAFDQDKMDGYLQFEDQIRALFDKYEGFRVHYRITQSSIEGARGIVLVDFQMEEIPRGGMAPPVRREGQLRLEMERGRKGWKIVDINPRGFFS
jgi:ABC-type transporter MlaC component